jgi:hypothetical protein
MTQEIGETHVENDPEPQLFAVSQSAAGYHFTRRDFLEAAAATAALAALTSCRGGDNGGGEVETPDTPFTATPAPADTATSRPTDTPASAQVVAISSFNVRGGPDTVYPIVGTLIAGHALPLLGRTADSQWLQVEFPPSVGWVHVSLVDVNVDLATVPVVEDLPTPTPSPTPEGYVKEGDEGIEFSIEGQTHTMPCGSPLPPGANCICDCVAAPVGGFICTCHDICTCHTVCSCVGATHYWYPN